ncbi:hypothetical protein HD806DRAFT_478063 [Xylariaceae sp. AK1471]|nr:hypothetical protein HD806DRAFT_478063 [Xylariaceae sp. AK1471]
MDRFSGVFTSGSSSNRDGMQMANNEPEPSPDNPTTSEKLDNKEMLEGEWDMNLDQAVWSNSDSHVMRLLKIRDDKIFEARDPGRTSDKIFGTDGLIKALFNAITNNKSPLANQLIRAKGTKLSNTNPTDESRRTPLHEAVRRENITIVNELLKHSECIRYIDRGDKDARAALHEAAACGNNQIIHALLMSGARVDVLDNCNMTPLHLMVWRGTYPREPTVVQELLDTFDTFGAEINTKDKAGSTPLHDACSNGDIHMVSTLLSYGADSGVRNAEGKTPPNAIPQGHEELRKLFARPWGISERKSSAKIPRERPVCPERNRKVCDDASVYVRYYWRGHGESWATSTSVSKLVYDETALQEIFQKFKGIMEMRVTTEQVTPNEGETWKWIHFSANNMTWIKDLVWLITHSEGYNPDERSRAWSFWERTINSRQGVRAESTRMPHAEDSWKEDGLRDKTNSTEDEPPEVPASSKKSKASNKPHRKGDDAFIETVESSREKASYEERRKARLFPKKRRLSLVLPFIDFETESYIRQREEGKVHGHLKKMMELFRLYSPYTGQDGLQIPKTLDESYYDMLHTTRITERDEDQVVFKWFKDQEKNKQPSKFEEILEFFSRYRIERILDDQTTMTGGKDSERSPNEEDPLLETVELTKSMASANVKAGAVRGDSTSNSAGIEQAGSPHGRPSLDKATPTAPGKVFDIPLKDCGKDCSEDPNTNNIAKLLMIHQLWLWKLDDNTVITCSPDRCHTGAEDTLIDTIRQGGIKSMYEPDDLIEHILYECATFLDEFRYAGLGVHVLDIFDSVIAKMSDEEVMSFKNFSSYMKDPPKGRKTSFNISRSITEEIRLLYEVKDVRDELNLLRRVFEAQAGVLEQFTRLFWPGLQEQSRRCREGFLEDCATKGLIDRTTRLDEEAKKTLEALDYLVQVKQAQSSLDEAEAARRLNNYIVLFTIVTIIFTPLSFITSLFAVPVNQFPHDEKSNLSYESTWITGRMFAGELTTLAVVFVIIMFQRYPSYNSDDYWRTWRKMWRRTPTFHDIV